MAQNWPSTLKNWLNRFLKNEYYEMLFLDNIANFQLELMILVQEPFLLFVKFGKIGQSFKNLRGNTASNLQMPQWYRTAYYETYIVSKRNLDLCT